MKDKKKDRSAKSRGFTLISLEIDAKLWKAFKIHAIDIEKTSSALIRELMEAELKRKKGR